MVKLTKYTERKASKKCKQFKLKNLHTHTQIALTFTACSLLTSVCTLADDYQGQAQEKTWKKPLKEA